MERMASNPMMSVEDYLKWCKHRAFRHLDANKPNIALASLIGDLMNHPGTAYLTYPVVATLSLWESKTISSLGEMRDYLDALC